MIARTKGRRNDESGIVVFELLDAATGAGVGSHGGGELPLVHGLRIRVEVLFEESRADERLRVEPSSNVDTAKRMIRRSAPIRDNNEGAYPRILSTPYLKVWLSGGVQLCACAPSLKGSLVDTAG